MRPAAISAAAAARSAPVVTLKFAVAVSSSRTRPPACSISVASSVAAVSHC
jgi:hypothetical protein